MDKIDLSSLDLIKIATEHAYSALHLLNNNAEVPGDKNGSYDALLPIASLMHIAFELTFKAYLLHYHKKINQNKSLIELIDLNHELDLSKYEKHLLSRLAKQLGFRKGVDYELFENRQSLHVFCSEIIKLYEHIQTLMPLELQSDYIQPRKHS